MSAECWKKRRLNKRNERTNRCAQIRDENYSSVKAEMAMWRCLETYFSFTSTSHPQNHLICHRENGKKIVKITRKNLQCKLNWFRVNFSRFPESFSLNPIIEFLLLDNFQDKLIIAVAALRKTLEKASKLLSWLIIYAIFAAVNRFGELI